jgi:hypothetical protein
MPSSARLTFADPYEYQACIGSSGVRVVVTKRGEFQAELTRIELHRQDAFGLAHARLRNAIA